MIERGSASGYEEERLPWLEPVEEEQGRGDPGMGKTIALVILGILLLGLAVGGYSWWSSEGATEGTGELIAAPDGPYKVKPPEPGGMPVEGEGDTAFAASEGAEPQGRINIAAVPEAPIERPQRGAAPEAEAKTEEDAPAPRTDGGGDTIQLGAFSSEASAKAAWEALSARFTYLEPLSISVIPVKSGERTLYRLRANGPGAAALCARLRVAGETCITVR